MIDYLARYTLRVAISNERILGMDENSVHLRVRDTENGNKKRTINVPAQTFIDRFFLRVLPGGFKRIRHYGLIGAAHKAVKLAKARAAQSVPTPAPVAVESVKEFMQRIQQHAYLRCTHCDKGQFRVTAAIAPTRAGIAHPRGSP